MKIEIVYISTRHTDQLRLAGPSTIRHRAPAHIGMTTASLVAVNTRSLRTSPPPQPLAGPRGEPRPIARLASLVDDVVDHLEAPAATDPVGLIPECNAALEACLDLLRDPGDRDNLVRTARDDLRRLSRLLKLVDGPDIPFVLRQIRRVLGRFDACGGRLVLDDDRGDRIA
jgi:hypothetical protein